MRLTTYSIFAALLLVFSVHTADAASLKVSPNTGVYTAGGTFTARVLIDTAGKPVNAAEGSLSFNPRELAVVSVSRGSSIFNLWTQEPTFSNGTGKISFGGGSPSGYTGSNGNVMTVTFRALNAGSPKVQFTAGSVLAADGKGTNVLNGMRGATYTVAAPTATPEPEYIAPAYTPSRPNITSTTHGDANGWHTSKTAELAWSLPGDVVAVRTLLDGNAGTIPTKVYDSPIKNITINDLDEGVSYFHIQFKNENGWGKVAHYRLAVDSANPTDFSITQPEDRDVTAPQQTVAFEVTDDTSTVQRYLIQIDGGEPIEFVDEKNEKLYTLPALKPGNHSIVVEAFDMAGNSIVGTFTFDIASFDKPLFTEYPTRVNDGVIPVLRGTTRPRSEVTIHAQKIGTDVVTYSIKSDDAGVFTFIPDEALSVGVYEFTAVATDEHGAQSDASDPIRFSVEEPGYVKIGSFVISVLSIIVPLVALSVLLIFGMWYLWFRLLMWRRKVRKETTEAAEVLAIEFDEIVSNLAKNVAKLKKSRRGKLTKAETTLIDEISNEIKDARMRIKKEVTDIEDLTT